MTALFDGRGAISLKILVLPMKNEQRVPVRGHHNEGLSHELFSLDLTAFCIKLEKLMYPKIRKKIQLFHEFMTDIKKQVNARRNNRPQH